MTAPRSRRPRGSGSIRREGSRWVVRLRVGGRDAERSCGSQAEALAALDELKRQAALGIPTRYTVSNCIDDFIAQAETRRWAITTTASYTEVLNNHVRPILGKRQLAELRVLDVQRTLDRMHQTGLSPRYISHARNVFRAAINHAMRMELVHRNVAGHSKIALTADLYGHHMPDQRAATAARMEGYLGSVVGS